MTEDWRLRQRMSQRDTTHKWMQNRSKITVIFQIFNFNVNLNSVCYHLTGLLFSTSQNTKKNDREIDVFDGDCFTMCNCELMPSKYVSEYLRLIWILPSLRSSAINDVATINMNKSTNCRQIACYIGRHILWRIEEFAFIIWFSNQLRRFASYRLSLSFNDESISYRCLEKTWTNVKRINSKNLNEITEWRTRETEWIWPIRYCTHESQ